MPTIREETYTTTEPDGTLVTTTTKTKTRYVREREFYCGRGTLNGAYCCRPAGILRILEIIIGLIIVSLISSVYGPGPFKGILFGQTFLLVFASVALCISFIFLIVFFFNLHESHLEFWPWRISDFLFSICACITYIVMGFLEAYYATGSWSFECSDTGSDGYINNGCRTIYEWVFASVR
ncbi:unnamed protein product [Anisakis simplex]|nr:unnamed protein product [Anisakis simplex]